MTWYATKNSSEDELYHHGIKGQRLGIRRYQNYDGSYTQAGMKRYNTAKNLYDVARQEYEKGNLSKADYKAAKHNEKMAYKQLKKDRQADQGAELYRKGKGINANNAKAALSGKILGGIGTASAAAAYKAYKSGNAKLTNAATAVLGSTVATGTVMGIILHNQNKKLRQFYAHSGASIKRGNKQVEKLLNTSVGKTKTNTVKKYTNEEFVSMMQEYYDKHPDL